MQSWSDARSAGFIGWDLTTQPFLHVDPFMPSSSPDAWLAAFEARIRPVFAADKRKLAPMFFLGPRLPSPKAALDCLASLSQGASSIPLRRPRNLASSRSSYAGTEARLQKGQKHQGADALTVAETHRRGDRSLPGPRRGHSGIHRAHRVMVFSKSALGVSVRLNTSLDWSLIRAGRTAR